MALLTQNGLWLGCMEEFTKNPFAMFKKSRTSEGSATYPEQGLRMSLYI